MRKLRIRVFCILLGCFPVLTGLAADLKKVEQKAEQKVERERFSLSFRDAPIQEVFDVLSRKDRVNIILGRNVSGNVSVNLYDVTVRDAIYRVAEAGGYTVEYRDGDYIVADRKEAGVENPGAFVQLRTFKVNYSDPRQVAEILTKHMSRFGKVTPLFQRRMVVIEDLPSFIERSAKLLEELDQQPQQVLIEARVLEIVLDDGEVFGVDWSKVFGSRTPGGTTGSFGTNGLSQGSAAAGPRSSGFFFSLVNSNLDVFLEAQATRSRVRTISSPKLLAIENQEAKTVIGNSTGYKLTTTINQVTTESIQFLESGVILRVTPSVDQQGRILIKVHPEVSSATINAGIPSKKSTEVTTEFLCEDGQSVFIGGLLKRSGLAESTGIPWLGTLPVIGKLFSTSTETVNNVETVVIITPRLVRDIRELGEYGGQKREQIDRANELIIDQELRLAPRLREEAPDASL
jgi:type II secretory pathway component GspD/PulD (secretin)